MMLKKCSIQPSGIHGLGCYADEDIAKGEVVWVFDARVDVDIAYEAYLDLPEAARAFMDVWAYFTETPTGVRVILCGDHSRHMNHSDDPNLLDTADENIALRDIRAGEELTCNYRLFDLAAAQKLGS